MKKIQQKEQFIKYMAVICTCILTGCGTIGLAQEATFESAYDNTPEEEIPIYTSFASGVLESRNEEDGTIVLYRMEQKDELTLSYTSATTVTDSYGAPLVMEQLTLGEMVDVSYNSELQKVGAVQISRDTFVRQGLSKYVLEIERGTLTVGNETYKVSESTKVFSGAEQIGLNQILDQDEITIRGYGYEVASVTVDQGHGYLKLENSEKLIGGWIEIGQALIQQISQDMLLTLPEGSYHVRITLDGGIEETRDITIPRAGEVVLDLSEIEIPEPVNGRVLFDIRPSTATAYVDGIYVDTSYAIRLPFGIHQITAALDGYDTVSEYFDVQGETTKVSLQLGERTETEETVSGNSTDSSSSDNNSYHTITIQAPEEAEVYFDNLYMGIAPVTFEKKSGSHTLTLRRSGYTTVSYQLEIDEDDRDLVYSFPDLVQGTTETVSGNELTIGATSNHTATENRTENGETVSGNLLETPKPQ